MKEVRLSEVCTINPAKSKELSAELLCSFVPMDYVDEESGSISRMDIRPVANVRKGYTEFREKDVIYAKITPCIENGKCAIARNLINEIGFGSTEFHVLRANSKTLPEWIYYYLRQERIRQQAIHWFRGTAGQQRVPSTFLKELQIPLPTLTEQQRIAAILDKADRLRRLRRYSLEIGDSYLQFVFLKMFGNLFDTSRKTKFGAVLAQPLANGLFEKNDRYGEGTPVIWVDNLYHTLRIDTSNLRRAKLKAKQINKYEVFEGDLLFTRSSLVREGIGQINLVPKLEERTTFESHVIRARVNEKIANPVFILGLYRTSFAKKELLKRSKTATMTTIGQDAIYDLPCWTPSIELQDKYARVFLGYERLRFQQEEALRQSKHLFQSLLHRAFEGEL